VIVSKAAEANSMGSARATLHEIAELNQARARLAHRCLARGHTEIAERLHALGPELQALVERSERRDRLINEGFVVLTEAKEAL